MDIDGVMNYTDDYINKRGVEIFQKEVLDGSKYSIQERFNVTEEEVRQFWHQIYADYLIHCEKTKGLKEFTRQLYEYGHKIVVITSRLQFDHGMNEEDVKELTRQFVYSAVYDYEKIIHTKDKGEIAKKLGIDLMIEDNEYFIEQVKEVCPVWCPMLPYNKDYLGNNTDSRVKVYRNFDEILEEMRKR